MKKVLAGLILIATAFSANAQHNGWRHGHHSGYYGNNSWNWVAPALIGGAVVYAATRPVIVQQQPVIVPPPTDIVYIDGIAYRKQVMVINGQYQEVLIRL